MGNTHTAQPRTSLGKALGLAGFFFRRKVLRRDLPLLASFKLTYRAI